MARAAAGIRPEAAFALAETRRREASPLVRCGVITLHMSFIRIIECRTNDFETLRKLDSDWYASPMTRTDLDVVEDRSYRCSTVSHAT